jgi:hypothetical protein
LGFVADQVFGEHVGAAEVADAAFNEVSRFVVPMRGSPVVALLCSADPMLTATPPSETSVELS